jgi:hypothetical protein
MRFIDNKHDRKSEWVKQKYAVRTGSAYRKCVQEVRTLMKIKYFSYTLTIVND